MDRFETALAYVKASGRAQLASAMEARNLRHQGEGVKALKAAAAAQCRLWAFGPEGLAERLALAIEGAHVRLESGIRENGYCELGAHVTIKEGNAWSTQVSTLVHEAVHCLQETETGYFGTILRDQEYSRGTRHEVARCYPDTPAIELEAFAVQWAVWHNTPIQ